MTYEIVLCDDNLEELRILKELISSYWSENSPDKQYELVEFHNAEEMLIWITEGKHAPDLLFLDVFLPGKTGIEAARDLRKKGNKVPIVFLTMSREYALDAYEVNAVQYLVKPLDREKFYYVIDFCLNTLMKKQEHVIVFKVGSSYRQLMQDEIIYCETDRNYQIVHLKNESLKVRATSKDMFARLQKFSQFIRCGTSYILNINHILKMDKNEICMDNDSCVFISKNRVAEFRKQYFDYYFSYGNETKI